MYSKDEASQIKQAFWTTFGQYIAPQLSADGLKVNWVNYKTGIKHLYFKMDADKNSAIIEQFVEIKAMLNSYLNEEWQWVLHDRDEYGKAISRIYKQINGVSIYNRSDWPQLISFFKPRIIALDEFWSVCQYSFEALK